MFSQVYYYMISMKLGLVFLMMVLVFSGAGSISPPSYETFQQVSDMLPFSRTPSLLKDILVPISNLHYKPTCYRAAAASLIHHCKQLPRDIPDGDRIQFAIKLTKCELDLIQQTPPQCLKDSYSKDCIKALASKDHWWTTFSGNLREVTNVCWIGRQEVEKGHFLDFLETADSRSVIGLAC